MAFIDLYNRISPRLKWIAKRCASPSCIDPDDLYQEMCMYLWDNYKEGAPPGINDTYIVKGCEFHARNYIRKHQNKVWFFSLEEPISENGAVLKDVLGDGSESADRAIDRKITIDTIMQNGFTRREKDVFSLLLEGYTAREAGKRLGISHVMVIKSKKRLIKKWQRKEKRVTKRGNFLLKDREEI